MTSANVYINGSNPMNVGYDASIGQELIIKLQDYTGVKTWVFYCVNADGEYVDTLNSQIQYFSKGNYYRIVNTFDNTGIYVSVVNSGRDSAGRVVPSYTKRIAIYTHDGSERLVSVNETTEGGSWLKSINTILRYGVIQTYFETLSKPSEDFTCNNLIVVDDASYDGYITIPKLYLNTKVVVDQHYHMTKSDVVVIAKNTTVDGDDLNIYLPPPVAGKIVYVIDGQSVGEGGNGHTVYPYSTELVMNASSYVMAADTQLKFVCDGTNWWLGCAD